MLPDAADDGGAHASPAARGLMSLCAIAAAIMAVLLVAPLVGWPQLVRVQATLLVPAFVFAMLVVRPWRFSPERLSALGSRYPSRRSVFVAAVIAGLILYWIVLTAFRSGQINAIDFTVYFDRPTFQTLHGRPLFVETTDLAPFAQRTALALHAYWAMLPLAALYAIAATPQWLLALSVVAVVAGAWHVLRIASYLRLGGPLACATALAFLLNDNTARTLGYGFHPEVLYAWFVPWLLDAGLRRKPVSFMAAAIACISVKEDAVMPIFAASVTLALQGAPAMTWRQRFFYLVTPVGLAFADLVVYQRWILPTVSPTGAPVYAAFWGNFGSTPMKALAAMAADPGKVLARALTSGFFRKVIVPHLFLPLIGWKWLAGVVPIVLLYGASANEQIRSFGIYYAIVLVPFLVIGASVGAARVAGWVWPRKERANLLPATAVLLGAMLLGGARFAGGGYTLRPWRSEIAAVPGALSALAGERRVLVQSGLYVRAGYSERVQLLTPDSVRDTANAGVVVLLAQGVNGYPFTQQEIDSLVDSGPARAMGPGLVAVRLPRR